MMVLMPGESGSASEGLLAIGIGALVGAFARVDATMSGKGTAIAEWLWEDVSEVF